MKKLKSYQIRQMWLDFWKSKDHDIIDSASLIPHNDPTLLWINAGVAPLKKFFDGTEVPTNRRMANVQKSIRTNDIENVGRTARHHTFFEMLGNFSIGDYFRDEALMYAFEILTDSKWFGFDLNKLYFTVYPNDEETIAKWISLGVDPSHIIKVKDNFWEIGEGPCGPDTEIFFDRGSEYDPDGLGIKMIEDDTSNERYIEIWNIVFSQYNAKAGKKRSEYKELPSKNIDTGMGLERMACVMQKVETNYETDLFMPIIDKCSKQVNVEYNGQIAFKVIADHLRSVVFALSDGAMFANDGRGYVLRRLLRRATRYARVLGMNEPFLYKLVEVVVNNMKVYYSYLTEKQELITKQIKLEEERFLITLESGEKRLLDYINNSKGKVINKEVAFLLYDTFGFPFELTVEVASEHGFTVDEQGFRELLAAQKQRAREARVDNHSMHEQNQAMINFKDDSDFVGYDTLTCEAKVIAIFKNGELVNKASNELVVVFDQTSFYAESGGQIGDVGTLSINNKNYAIGDTFKLPNGQHASVVQMKEDELKLGDRVVLAVDEDFRQDVAKNHSATHLLNQSLREIVGKHVYQHGSQVYNYGLRFDFNNYEPLTNKEILAIENLVNQEINKGHRVKTLSMKLDEAKKENVQAVFGEKYGDIVRVVDMDFSKELCGGTHVNNTKDIERFAIVSIETKGSGIYRIEASTSHHIKDELSKTLENINIEIDNNLQKINNLLETGKNNDIELKFNVIEVSDEVDSYQMVINRRQELEQIRHTVKELEKEYQRLLKEKNTIPTDKYLSKVININDNNILIINEENINIEIAKDLVDRLSDKLKNSCILLAISMGNKVIFICKNKIEKLHAGNLVKLAAVETSGNGGGRQDFAQAGGKDSTKLEMALTKVKKEIESKL